MQQETGDEGQTTESNAGSSITANGGTKIAFQDLTYFSSDQKVPKVYFISDITPEALVQVYEAMNWSPTGKVGVKLSTGEPPASNYLDPALIKDLVLKVNGTIVECNTSYGGSRASKEMHYQVAEDHGFTAIADFKLLDEDGSMTLPVEGGTRLKENYVGAAFADYDSYLVLSHFKGHVMAGFGVLMAATIGVPLYACGGGTIPLLKAWLIDGMSLGSAASFMVTGPATKITNLGALKSGMGIRHFIYYISFALLFALATGMIVNIIV